MFETMSTTFAPTIDAAEEFASTLSLVVGLTIGLVVLIICVPFFVFCGGAALFARYAGKMNARRNSRGVSPFGEGEK